MNPNQDRLPVESLVESALTGRLWDGDASALRQHLTNDPAALDAYLQQVRLHALLEWRSGKVSQTPAESERAAVSLHRRPDAMKSGRSWFAASPARWSVAAAVLLAVGLAIYIASQQTYMPSPNAERIGVVAMSDAVGTGGQRALQEGDLAWSGPISIDSGTLVLTADSGATITLVGPARVDLLSPMRLRAVAGRVTVRVDDARAKGFTVVTPNADVVDLGTEFGVQVDAGGQTSVVVFEGMVDLSPRNAQSAGVGNAIRLNKGEGLRVDLGGLLQPIFAVARRVGSTEWRIGMEVAAGDDADSVIASVRDNRRDPADTKYYQIVRRGLDEDVPAYVDRVYQWNTIGKAGELIGADLIQTFNSDKREQDLEVTVELAKPAALYVFHEPRLGEVPDWLKKDFVDTGLKIGLDEGPPDMPQLALEKGAGKSVDRIFTVWRREVRQPGPVTLGRNTASSKSMYGVAAKALK